jgi:hypothetical protein
VSAWMFPEEFACSHVRNFARWSLSTEQGEVFPRPVLCGSRTREAFGIVCRHVGPMCS